MAAATVKGAHQLDHQGLVLGHHQAVDTVGIREARLDEQPEDSFGDAVRVELLVALVDADQHASGGFRLEVRRHGAVHQTGRDAVDVIRQGDPHIGDGSGEVDGGGSRRGGMLLSSASQRQGQQGNGRQGPKGSLVQRHDHLKTAKASSLAWGSRLIPRWNGDRRFLPVPPEGRKFSAARRLPAGRSGRRARRGYPPRR